MILIVGTDTITITANISEKPAIEFEPIDEEQANILAQLVANDLSKQTFGMSSQDGIDILRSEVDPIGRTKFPCIKV